MELNEYQQRAVETDQLPGTEGDAIIVPLLGIAGETAALLAQYKKRIRDGAAHELFRDHVSEELGDLLWYVADLASKFELPLDDIAEANLRKTHGRFAALTGPTVTSAPLLFDDGFPEGQFFPRQMTAKIWSDADTRGRPVARLSIDGAIVGHPLRDNAYKNDGYRFHDAFHLGNVALLGWSPTIRGLMHLKRKSDPATDEVEDGGRAIVVDEGIAAYVFDYARRNRFLEGVKRIDYEVLRTISNLTAGFEVSVRSPGEWEHAILTSMAVWRGLRIRQGGTLRLDLVNRRFLLETD
jgi:NTP pyrophosphatase (non-canonical NTP hydrolase)